MDMKTYQKILSDAQTVDPTICPRCDEETTKNLSTNLVYSDTWECLVCHFNFTAEDLFEEIGSS